jgi:hypothetical protein
VPYSGQKIGCSAEKAGDILRMEVSLRSLDVPEILIIILTLAGLAWAAYHYLHGEPHTTDRSR